jgi:sterol desaturase/sphingolipid hydroxylase (fatty acid hydroxylase superfamily)
MDNIATNVELLYDKAKKYVDTNIDLLRLNAVDKTADVMSSLIARIIIVMIVAMFTLFINIGISLYIGKLIGAYYLGFVIISTFYLLLAILLYFYSNRFIKIPLTNLIIIKLLKTKDSSTNILDLIKKNEDEKE